jgi:hypothetical protein
VSVIPPDKKFTLPKSQVKAQASKPPSHMIT